MTPYQLAKDSESSQQQALFCFVNKAIRVGFAIAKQPSNWVAGDDTLMLGIKPVPELAWYHAIPNGGSRGDTARSRAIEGGRMKAEGVRPGVLDTFWPLSRQGKNVGRDVSFPGCYCGLYIELKKPALMDTNKPTNGLSDEQIKFGEFAINQGYCCRVAYSWLEAAEILEWYYSL